MVTDAELRAALSRERIRLHLKVLPVTLVTSLAVGALLAFAVGASQPVWAAAWCTALALALAARAAVGAAQHHDTEAVAHAEAWLRRHRLAFLGHGAVWGLLALATGQPPLSDSAELAVFALAAITAGAFVHATFDLRASVAFAALPVLGMVLGALRAPGTQATAMWLLALVIVAVGVVGARRGQRTLGEAIRLRLAAQQRAEEARAQAERADGAYRQLDHQHQLMKDLLQNTRQGFWFIDTDARTTDLNPGMANLLGRPREDVLGRRAHEFVAPEALPELERELQQRARGELGHYEVSLLRPDGTRVHCLCQASPLRDADGRRIGSVGLWTDISERRRAEATLRGYELAVNSITEVVSVVDTDERYLLVNEAWTRYTGVPREQALGIPAVVAAPTVVAPERRRAVQDCVATGRVQVARIRDICEGHERLLETTYYPQTGDDGRVQTIAMVTRDITVAERQRTALEAREAAQRALLDAFPGHIARLDASFVFTFVNRRLAALLGLPPEDLVGRPVAEVLGPRRAARVQEAARRALAGETVDFEMHRVQRPGGPPVDLHVTLVRGSDPQTAATALYGFAVDITARKEAEGALRESEAELRALLAAFPGYITAVNRDNRYIYVSDRSAAVFGRPASDLIGLRVDEALPGERAMQVCAQLDRARAGWPSVAVRHYVDPADGRVIVMEITHVAGPLQADGRRTTYAFGVDITARHRAEEALIAARDEAERANRAKSEFLSHMSHELRTPMNAILGFGQLLQSDQRPPLAPQQQGWVEEILRGAGHLLELINEILDLGRIEAGEMKLDRVPVPLAPLLGEGLALVQGLAVSFGVPLRPLPEGLDGLAVQADRRRLKQVLLNLLANAIKYNRPGGDVLVAVQDEGSTLRLSVRDRGPGLTPQEQARLFQPFERLAASRSGIEGTGIGLALSRRLVQAMGGEIGVDSRPGEGSDFWLRLPRATPGAAMPALPAPRAPAPEPTAGLHTVLYIEDNEVNVALMAAMLERLPGVRLLSALHPHEGLKLAQQARPALVLLDMQLPEIDGFGVLARLRADPATQHVPVIAVSANALQGDIDAALAAGFDEYLTKPVPLDDLLATVRRRLGGG
ncbi:MAG: PAS domain-containing protein [Rubrivivax sp.]|nr:PAS domain-containing protein [Rubrivivax sp.]